MKKSATIWAVAPGESGGIRAVCCRMGMNVEIDMIMDEKFMAQRAPRGDEDITVLDKFANVVGLDN